MTKSRHINTPRYSWTEEATALVVRDYANRAATEIAAQLGVKVHVVYKLPRPGRRGQALMGQHTTISWTHFTFNPWVGCTKISPACDACYAESWAKRSGLVTWGGPRRRTSPANWKQPLKWHTSIPDGERRRVFCASLADVFDNEVPDEWRFDLFELIRETPRLDWLLLTKRVGNAKRMLMQFAMEGAYNVWLGATVANQEEADRDIPKLLVTPARVRFLSCEPLLGRLNLRNLCIGIGSVLHTAWGIPAEHDHFDALHAANRTRLDWVIAGGESGSKARPSHPDWFRSLRDQCIDAGVPFHFKQHGEWLEVEGDEPVREIEAESNEADAWFDPQTDCLIANDGRIFSLETLPKDVPARLMKRVGKEVAGRTLDGRIWDEFPRAPG
jgi:protein gp37